MVTEVVQTLADGTHVRTGTHDCGLRDCAGRTREEIALPSMPGDNGERLSQVMIIDAGLGPYLFWNLWVKRANGWRLSRFERFKSRGDCPEKRWNADLV